MVLQYPKYPRHLAYELSRNKANGRKGVSEDGVGNRRLPGGSGGKESVCRVGGPGSIPGLGSSPGEGDGHPLQCSCLENPMDRGAWRAIGCDWAALTFRWGSQEKPMRLRWPLIRHPREMKGQTLLPGWQRCFYTWRYKWGLPSTGRDTQASERLMNWG